MTQNPQHWLIKSEPEVFGIEDLRSAPGRRTHWDGVRNFQARNYLRDEMCVGDLAYFYHSNCAEPGIAGIVQVCKSGYPDPSQFDKKSDYYDARSTRALPRWYMVDVRFVRKLKSPITLEELRKHADDSLSGLSLLRRGNRLSVSPVSTRHWQFIATLE
jgi:predicted RNA-binding protein with PUA-like domain